MGMDSTLHEGMEGTTLLENVAMHALDLKLHEPLSDMALTDSSLLYNIRDDDNFLVSPNETFEYEALPPLPIDPSNECSFDAANEPIMGDCMNGRYTAEERLSLGLLQLLCKISAPKYAYASIMALFADATQAKATVTTTFCT